MLCCPPALRAELRTPVFPTGRLYGSSIPALKAFPPFAPHSGMERRPRPQHGGAQCRAAPPQDGGAQGGAPASGAGRGGSMADDKDSLPKLKDLALLKGQLETLQRRVEDEVQAGVGQGGSLLASPFVKGFLAGYLVAKLRFSAVLGFAVGTCTGIYAAQNYAVPDVEKTVRDCLGALRKGGR
ncbi:SLC35A4 upstream open reading frame protein [Excalfactoria chinensis]|uniref:SLC35A4 upstream open reading frame protein n=1 Tax=Excalfactoria chinensis TaxID=46218 RepID=UPI003B3B6B6D